MKQAFLITAYDNFEWIRKIVDIYRKEVDCFIHVDKKVNIPKEFKQWAKQTEGVYVYAKYKINWGSYKHISAVLFLLNEALNDPKREEGRQDFNEFIDSLIEDETDN